MLQYISYLQLCSNVLQNKLSRRQQKYIVNVYKNCTAFMGYNLSFYMSIGSVVFSSYVLRKRNEMPKIKGKKIYINHMDFTPLKTQSATSVLGGAAAAPDTHHACPALPPTASALLQMWW